MLDLIEFIDNKIKKVSKNDTENILKKLILLKHFSLYLNNHKITSKIDEIIMLDELNTGYSEYRIVNDCESDDSTLWIEYINNHKKVRLNSGDFLIKMK